MKHAPLTFGKADRCGWLLRAQSERRRQARTAALVCAAISLVCSVGAGIAAAFNNVGGAALLGIFAAISIVVGVAAASEA